MGPQPHTYGGGTSGAVAQFLAPLRARATGLWVVGGRFRGLAGPKVVSKSGDIRTHFGVWYMYIWRGCSRGESDADLPDDYRIPAWISGGVWASGLGAQPQTYTAAHGRRLQAYVRGHIAGAPTPDTYSG
eukprot:gene22689-biopygen17755